MIKVFVVIVAIVCLGGIAQADGICSNGIDAEDNPCECNLTPVGCNSCLITSKAQTCLSCQSGYTYDDGACLPYKICVSNKVVGTDELCYCAKDCNRCRIYGDGSSTCEQCRNSMYFSQGACIASCPEGLSAYGTAGIGRQCLPAFTCKSFKPKNAAGDLAGLTSCKCEDANCHQCEYGPSGNRCSYCKNGFYLLDGKCVASCPTGLPVGSGNFGRYCTTATSYICSNEREVVTGAKCTCPITRCHTCRVSPAGATCDKCGSFLYLYNNQCLKDCPAGLIEQKPLSAVGRACLEPKEP